MYKLCYLLVSSQCKKKKKLIIIPLVRREGGGLGVSEGWRKDRFINSTSSSSSCTSPEAESSK